MYSTCAITFLFRYQADKQTFKVGDSAI